MIPRRVLAPVALAVAVVATGACGGDSDPTAAVAPDPAAASPPPAAAPVTAESCGRSFTYQAPPERIVVGHPTTAATLVALGVGDKVVGWTGGSLGPAPAQVPNATEISSQYQAPREAVLAARPDLFLTNDENQLSGESGGLGYGDLGAAGGSAYVLGAYCLGAPGATDLETVYRDVANVARIVGRDARGDELVGQMRERVAAARALGSGRPPLAAALVQVFDGKLFALTGSYYKMVLDAIGATSVFDGQGLEGNFSEISAERVLTLSPAAVFVIYDSEETRESQLDEARALLASSPAVQQGRVVGLLNATTSAGGVSLVDAVEAAARGAFG